MINQNVVRTLLFLSVTFIFGFGHASKLHAQCDPPIINPPGFYNFVIPECSTSVLGVFTIQIFDYCGTVNPANATFNLDGTLLSPGYTQSDQGHFRFSFTLDETHLGIKVLTISYTDANAQMASLPVLFNTVKATDPDTRIVMPGFYNFHVPECEEFADAVFSVNIFDGCGNPNPNNAHFYMDGQEIFPTFINTSRGYFEFSRDIYPDLNTTLMLVQYTDILGNSISQDAIIKVYKEADPPFAASCLSEVNIPLDSSCMARLSYKQLLAGCVACLDSLDIGITVNDSLPGNGNKVDGPGTYTYDINIPSREYSCSGVLHARGFGQYAFCNDQDGDGIPDALDNCPDVSNASQTDSNGNGIGDDCEGIAGSDDSPIATAAGDVVVENSARGLVLKSFSGDCYRVTVDGFGMLRSTKIDCP